MVIKIILKCVLFAIAMTGLIWWIAYIIGISQLEEDYLKEYEELKSKVITYRDHTPENEADIRKAFDTISKYKCRNYEKLQALEQFFGRRIKAIQEGQIMKSMSN